MNYKNLNIFLYSNESLLLKPSRLRKIWWHGNKVWFYIGLIFFVVMLTIYVFIEEKNIPLYILLGVTSLISFSVPFLHPLFWQAGNTKKCRTGDGSITSFDIHKNTARVSLKFAGPSGDITFQEDFNADTWPYQIRGVKGTQDFPEGIPVKILYKKSNPQIASLIGISGNVIDNIMDATQKKVKTGGKLKKIKTASKIIFSISIFIGFIILIAINSDRIASSAMAEILKYISEKLNTIKLNLSIAGSLLLCLFYFLSWYFMQSNFPVKKIKVRTSPPENISPAILFRLKKWYADITTIFSILIYSLAAKGYLKITGKIAKGYTHAFELIKKNESSDKLSYEEKQVVRILFKNSDSIWINRKNSKTISKAIDSLKLYIKENVADRYFKKTRWLAILGLILLFTFIVLVTIYNAVIIKDIKFLIIPIFSILAGLSLRGEVWLWYQFYKEAKDSDSKSLYIIFFIIFSIIIIGVLTPFFFVEEVQDYILSIRNLVLSFTVFAYLLYFSKIKTPTPDAKAILNCAAGYEKYLRNLTSHEFFYARDSNDNKRFYEKHWAYISAMMLLGIWDEKLFKIIEETKQNINDFVPFWYEGTIENFNSDYGFLIGLEVEFESAVDHAISENE